MRTEILEALQEHDRDEEVRVTLLAALASAFLRI